MKCKNSRNELFLPFSAPLTFFAPTDEAFGNLTKEEFKKLDSDPELLKNVLLGHVVPKKALFYRGGALEEDQVYESAAPTGPLLRVNIYLKSKFFDVSRYFLILVQIGYYLQYSGTKWHNT